MVNLSPQFSGEWLLEIFNKDGSSYFPFGQEFRKNMLLDCGLKLLLQASYYGVGPSLSPGVNFNYQTIPAFIKGGAAIGDGTTIPKITDIGLENVLATTETMLVNHREYYCKYEDSLVNGTRSYTRIFDFPAITSEINFNEAGVYSDIDGSYYSRFLFPSTARLAPGQYIRLVYKFIVGVQAIKTPISVSVASGSFNASGQIKLVGKFDNIFGAMNTTGTPITIEGDTPRSSIIPFCQDFYSQVGSTVAKISPSAFLLGPEQALNNTGFPPIGNALVTTWVGQKLSIDNGTIVLSDFDTNTMYRDCTYTFDVGNPALDDGVGGILFTNGQSASPESGKDRDITWDGWVWKFNVPQTKLAAKKLTIVLRSTVGRIV